MTKHAPADFPNLLTENAYPVDERTRLRQSIAAIEERIEADIAGRSTDSQQSWTAALRAARQSTEAHDILFSNRRLFERFDWARTDLLSRTMLEHRLALLTEIAAAIGRSGGSRPS